MKNVITCSIASTSTNVSDVPIYKCEGFIGFQNDDGTDFMKCGEWEEPRSRYQPYRIAVFKMNFFRAYIAEFGRLPNLSLHWQELWEEHREKLSTDRRLLLENLLQRMMLCKDEDTELVDNYLVSWYCEVTRWAMMGMMVDF